MSKSLGADFQIIIFIFLSPFGSLLLNLSRNILAGYDTLIRFSISEVGIFQFPLGLLSWKYLVLEISEITSASSLRVCLQLTRDCCVLEQAPAVKY